MVGELAKHLQPAMMLLWTNEPLTDQQVPSNRAKETLLQLRARRWARNGLWSSEAGHSRHRRGSASRGGISLANGKPRSAVISSARLGPGHAIGSTRRGLNRLSPAGVDGSRPPRYRVSYPPAGRNCSAAAGQASVGNRGNTGERLDAGPAECCRGAEGLRDGVLDSGEGAGGGGASG
jgi:hypothetical protein